MKTYPLEVKELLEFEGGQMGYWSKGHHDLEAFTLDALWRFGKEIYNRRGKVQHETWRAVPQGKGMWAYEIASPGTRGAFPVTVVYV